MVFVSGLVAGLVLAAAVAVALQGAHGGDGRVTGIGGVFFKAEDPEALRAWYREHLGIDSGRQGADFTWRHPDDPDRVGRTVWTIFPEDTEYFGPGDQELMINYRVDDLDALLGRIRDQGVEQVGEVEEYSYGRFAWVLDAEGNRVELWEPVDEAPGAR